MLVQHKYILGENLTVLVSNSLNAFFSMSAIHKAYIAQVTYYQGYQIRGIT